MASTRLKLLKCSGLLQARVCACLVMCLQPPYNYHCSMSRWVWQAVWTHHAKQHCTELIASYAKLKPHFFVSYENYHATSAHLGWVSDPSRAVQLKAWWAATDLRVRPCSIGDLQFWPLSNDKFVVRSNFRQLDAANSQQAELFI